MIHIAGAAERSFTFPADPLTASTYFRDFKRILGYLAHIRLLWAYGPDRFRLLYGATELGIYRVRILCDVQATFDEAEQTLTMSTLSGIPPVAPRAGMYSLAAQGYYASASTFHPAGDCTRIEYKLQLHAHLPKPLGSKRVPDAIVEQIARNITQRRIQEIADGFIERSISEFRQSVGHRPDCRPDRR
jgi:hypothetical protein